LISEAVRWSTIKTVGTRGRKMYNSEATIVSGSGTATITRYDRQNDPPEDGINS